MNHTRLNKPMLKPTPRSSQRGATLMISLMILLIMTLIGITSMNTASLEEKMAGNDRDQNLSFQAAEAALRQAEDFVNYGIVTVAVFDGTTAGFYVQGSDPNILDPDTWTDANSISYSSSANNVTINYIRTAPRYIIEIISTVGDDDINISGYGESSGSGTITAFRVTARGTGGTDGAVTLLQSNFGRRF